MAKKKIQSYNLLDFNTGETIIDTTFLWASIQKKLFTIDNPYVGNKRKIVVDIAQSLQNNGIEYTSVLDLFSGSGVVSLFMKLIGKDVYSNDLLTSSFFNALVFVENSIPVLTQDEINYFCKNSNSNKNDFITNNYSERFTKEEAQFLDNYRANVRELTKKKLQHYIGSVLDSQNIVELDALAITSNGYEKWLLNPAILPSNGNAYKAFRCAYIFEAAAILLVEHYIMSRCFIGGRLNKGQVLAQVGHRIAHNRNLGNSMGFLLDELPVFAGNGKYKAYNLDAEQLLMSSDCPEADLLYLDPPYGGGQSDYAQMFAFNEEYFYGDKLNNLPHLNNSHKFVNKKDYENHFRNILDKSDKYPNWAISFNNDSFTDCDGIVKIIKDFRKNIIVVNIDYEYNYRKEENTSGVEHLIIARN